MSSFNRAGSFTLIFNVSPPNVATCGINITFNCANCNIYFNNCAIRAISCIIVSNIYLRDVFKITESFGQCLRDIRKSKGLTLKELGKQAGFSYSYLSQIERGERGVQGIPSPEILKKLAIPLGVSYEELMTQAGYWLKTDMNSDSYVDLSYSLNLKNKIISILKFMVDDDGFFPQFLHEEIFEIFEGWLRLDENNKISFGFDKFYRYDYLPRPDKGDYFGNDYLEEIKRNFNNVYNYTAIKNGIISYQGYESLEDVLQNLILLAHNQEIEVSEPMLPLSHIELSDILPNQSVIILYNDKPLSPSDRHRLLGMLDVISKYPDEK